MRYLRLAAGTDGISRFSEQTPELAAGGGASELSAPVPLGGAVFLQIAAGTDSLPHPAPRRQFLVVLSGAAGITDGAGRTEHCGPGALVLVENTTGAGHRTRVTSSGPLVLLTLPLAGERLEYGPAPAETSPVARFFGIHTAADGGSVFRDEVAAAAGRSLLGVTSPVYPATALIFRRSAPDQHIDWHPAPRRQFVVTLAGAAEVEATTGEVRAIGPGTVMLANDLTGKGHITRSAAPVERLSLFIPLAD